MKNHSIPSSPRPSSPRPSSPRPSREAVVAIVGSGFSEAYPDAWDLRPLEVETPWGVVVLHQFQHSERVAYVLFRHGLPHRWLPNQIPYKAHAWAIRAAGCGALLSTSSVGVLDSSIPLDALLDVHDIMALDNRLPDGSACSMHDAPTVDQGHLVLKEGLLSGVLRSQLVELSSAIGLELSGPVRFAYVGGPRTKTSAENRVWQSLGAQVNSMTLAPEIILANELEIPCAAVVTGHKYSVPDDAPSTEFTLELSLIDSGKRLEKLITAFLKQGQPVPFANMIYRFRTVY